MSVLLWTSGAGAGGQDRLCRGLAVAEALAVRGLATRVALPVEHAALGWLEAAGVRNPILLPERVPQLRHVLAARGGADAVVVDVDRPLSRAEVRALAGGRRVVVIEGRGPGLAEADIVVALERDARRSRVLHGPAWVPLRRAVRLARDLRGQPRPVPLVVVHVDARDDELDVARVLTGLAAVRAAGVRLVGRVLADPCIPSWSRLACLARRLELSPPVPALPDTSLATLAEADVAIVGSGMAVFEAVVCGVATVAIGGAPGVAALAAGGAVVALPAGVDGDRVGATVRSLATSPSNRAALTAAGHALVDGLGADRVADRLIELLGASRTIDVGERRVG